MGNDVSLDGTRTRVSGGGGGATPVSPPPPRKPRVSDKEEGEQPSSRPDAQARSDAVAPLDQLEGAAAEEGAAAQLGQPDACTPVDMPAITVQPPSPLTEESPAAAAMAAVPTAALVASEKEKVLRARAQTEGADAEVNSSPLLAARAHADSKLTSDAFAQRWSVTAVDDGTTATAVGDIDSDARADGRNNSFTLPPQAVQSDPRSQDSGGSGSTAAPRRGQYLSLDFLPTSPPLSQCNSQCNSAPPSLLPSTSPSPRSSGSASTSASGVSTMGSSCSVSSSSLSLPPPFFPVGGGGCRHSSAASSANSSSSSSPRISSSILAHQHHPQHGHSHSHGHGHGHTAHAASLSSAHQLPPRSPLSHSLSPSLAPLSPPTLNRPFSDPERDHHQRLSSAPAASTSASVSAVSSASSSPSSTPRTVETLVVHTHYTPNGQKQINQYVIESELGRGSYGSVRLVYNTEDHHYYAMKVMNKSLLKKRRVLGFSAGLTASGRTASLGGLGGMSPGAIRGALLGATPSSPAPAASTVSTGMGTNGSPSLGGVSVSSVGGAAHWSNVQREIAIMKKLSHPNIVRLHEVMDDPAADALYLVMEHLAAGALMPGEIESLRALDLDTAWGYFRDIIMGLEYLHFQKVVHRDLKPENLLISASGHLKISDFGVSMLFDGEDDRIASHCATVGSAAFLAPEFCGGGLGTGGATAGSGCGGIGSVPTVSAPPPTGSTSRSPPTPSLNITVSVPTELPSAAASAAASPAAASSPRHLSCSPKAPTPALLAALQSSTGRNNPFGVDGRSFSMPVGVAPPLVSSGASFAHGHSGQSGSGSGTGNGSLLPSQPLARSHSYTLGTSSSAEISGKKGDIWSCGVTLYVMLFGRLPFVAKTVALIYRSIVEDDLHVPPFPPDAGSNPNNIQPDTHGDLIDLVQRLLDKNPHTRITIQEIKRHPWVTRGGRQPLEEQCDYEGAAATGPLFPSFGAPMQGEGDAAAAARRAQRAARKKAQQQQQHTRVPSGGVVCGSVPLDPALEEDEEGVTTDTEVDEEEGDEVPGMKTRTTTGPYSSAAWDSISTRGRSTSYQSIMVSEADMAEAVTLVSKVVLVVKLKAKMRKARLQLQLNANAANLNARARSSSVGDVSQQSMQDAKRILGGMRGGGGGGAGSNGRPLLQKSASSVGRYPSYPNSSPSPPPSAAPGGGPRITSPMSPSLSAHTRISVPVRANSEHHTSSVSAQSKRRAVGPTSHLLAQARAAISAGTAGPLAAQAWDEQSAAPATVAPDHNTDDSLGVPSRPQLQLSPTSPSWGQTRGRGGRILQFPHRRVTPRSSDASRTGDDAASQDQNPLSPAMDAGVSSPEPVAPIVVASAAPAAVGTATTATYEADSEPASGSLSASVVESDSDLVPPSNLRHQSAPVRAPPALYVPLSNYATTPQSLSCTHAHLDDEVQSRATRFLAAQAQAELVADQAQHMHLQRQRHQARDESEEEDGEEDGEVESIEPDQDLLDI